MKIVKKTNIGTHQVFSTNVKNLGNYVTSNGVVNKNCVIDHGYSGEVHLNMINVGTVNQVIQPGDKIVQGILIPVVTFETLDVPEEELYRDIHVAGSRGTGGFGSTDK